MVGLAVQKKLRCIGTDEKTTTIKVKSLIPLIPPEDRVFLFVSLLLPPECWALHLPLPDSPIAANFLKSSLLNLAVLWHSTSRCQVTIQTTHWERAFHTRSASVRLLYVIYETSQVEQSTAGEPNLGVFSKYKFSWCRDHPARENTAIWHVLKSKNIKADILWDAIGKERIVFILVMYTGPWLG